MCGRYLIEIGEEELREIIAAAEKERGDREDLGQLSFTYRGGEIFPGSTAPVITGNEVCFMKWGFPSSIANQSPHINARSETAMTSKTFGDAMASRRCIVPASAYYEWKKLGKKRKVKYEVTLTGRATMYMAGIYSDSGQFAVLTREAAPSIIEIHDRMPVILSKSNIDAWLRGSPEVMKEALTDLQLAPVPADEKPSQQLYLFT